jgi:hypothetical protein
MKFCSKCGAQLHPEAVICPQCGCAVEPVAPVVEDKVSVGLVILAIFIPLFGIIYWPCTHKKTPRRARACGIAAIISWVVSFIISMSSMAAIFEQLL